MGLWELRRPLHRCSGNAVLVIMIAPFNTGVYGEMWEVAQSNKVVCQFYVYIQVP